MFYLTSVTIKPEFKRPNIKTDFLMYFLADPKKLQKITEPTPLLPFSSPFSEIRKPSVH